MTDDLKEVLSDVKESMDKALEHTKNELKKIRAGKASASMLDPVQVAYYGSPTPLQQVANVNTPDAKTITVQPWEKSLVQDIERAIINSNLGFAPQTDGERIIISLPPLTEERRIDLVKQAKGIVENGKIGVRSARKDGNELVRSLKDEISEDELKEAELEIQELTNQYINKAEALLKVKETEIMTI